MPCEEKYEIDKDWLKSILSTTNDSSEFDMPDGISNLGSWFPIGWSDLILTDLKQADNFGRTLKSMMWNWIDNVNTPFFIPYIRRVILSNPPASGIQIKCD